MAEIEASWATNEELRKTNEDLRKNLQQCDRLLGGSRLAFFHSATHKC